MATWVGLGGNLPETRPAMIAALETLDASPSINGLKASGLYQTRPWGDTNQPDFLNAVLRCETVLGAESLLELLLQLEITLGRDRQGGSARRWGPRVIDLDLLAYDDLMIDSEHLVLPHPRMHLRAFVLVPLLELEPGFEIVGQGSATDCLNRLPADEIRSVKPLGAWRPDTENCA